MMFQPETRQRIAEELARGEQARREGYEGRARVCARRAAGAAVREYLAVRQKSSPAGLPPSAYELLAILLEQPDTTLTMRQRAEYLLVRVNQDFTLPVDVDLLAEARALIEDLERQLSEGNHE